MYGDKDTQFLRNQKNPVQIIDSYRIIYAREERLELPTLGFGDRCSTN